ncbi:MAG TPA: HK97 gp10 family phage protein [Amaricoccus sp.]|uniref:HK97 gp10 family phage protein n=1 Tax=Amaricoccus sp. TaxID=1872485 RepID=UPI002BD56E61|nr:HK97 gp10 family phage protein [Amaricoccus sp.]HMR51189.1 HK97 gp10 family phage protein [Amaricoccus sp.]HMT98063.1 HK97 gp10 family phage protein [Amaricoccus sp.]
MVTTVKVEGLRETEAALAELGKSLGKGVLRRVAIKALQPFDSAWRGMAPDDPGTGGDDLRSSGGVSTRLSKRQAKLHRKAFRNDRASVEVFAGSNDAAAVPLEFGTVERFQKSGKAVGAVAPHPFVRPAWDGTKDAMPAAIGRDLWVEIEKAAARKAKKAAKLAARG